ncbi:AmmeMemoRadiSam system protein A [Azonexus hydrophilus]|uniref:AmmeMemoRadiSam system protein A n=1 Tax=Azonexus hydrophilus TaxID=418702 RepID=UPI00248F7DDA|nr:AmmeMemoRadiSam system protein A [Azonexus hydrophilus]
MDELGQTLLQLARRSISEALGQAAPATPDLPALHEPGATFVTLTQAGELRGCIGSLEAHRPLIDDVQANAHAAAFRDPRFPPLTRDELARTRVEVSLLSPAEPLFVTDEADALARLRPQVDGLILAAGGRRATFLPQVWEQLPEPAVFLARLKQKAGLSGTYWSPELRLWRYTVQKWQENPR